MADSAYDVRPSIAVRLPTSGAEGDADREGGAGEFHERRVAPSGTSASEIHTIRQIADRPLATISIPRSRRRSQAGCRAFEPASRVTRSTVYGKNDPPPLNALMPGSIPPQTYH
jgi:hypothetical protein